MAARQVFYLFGVNVLISFEGGPPQLQQSIHQLKTINIWISCNNRLLNQVFVEKWYHD
jgi:hypothetical protein